MSLAIDSDATLVGACPPCRRADDDAERSDARGVAPINPADDDAEQQLCGGAAS
jgi:hypothetical protein